MIQELAAVLRRSRATLVEDLLGAIALAVILIGALHLPGTF
ncbi:MAG: hypothetical protein ACLFQL_12535 [Paracoccaceae bacterium]